MNTSCKKPSHSFVLFNNISIHIFILFTILSSIYVFFISKVESKAINEELVNVIKKNLDPENLDKITSKEKQELSDLVNKIEGTLGIPSFISSLINKQVDKVDINESVNKKIIDKELLENLIDQLKSGKNELASTINSKVSEQIVIVIGFLIMLVIIINLLPNRLCQVCNSLYGILGELIFVFSFIGIIEYWFFTNVASKFSPSVPSDMVRMFKEELLKVAKS